MLHLNELAPRKCLCTRKQTPTKSINCINNLPFYRIWNDSVKRFSFSVRIEKFEINLFWNWRHIILQCSSSLWIQNANCVNWIRNCQMRFSIIYHRLHFRFLSRSLAYISSVPHAWQKQKLGDDIAYTVWHEICCNLLPLMFRKMLSNFVCAKRRDFENSSRGTANLQFVAALFSAFLSSKCKTRPFLIKPKIASVLRQRIIKNEMKKTEKKIKSKFQIEICSVVDFWNVRCDWLKSLIETTGKIKKNDVSCRPGTWCVYSIVFVVRLCERMSNDVWIQMMFFFFFAFIFAVFVLVPNAFWLNHKLDSLWANSFHLW